LRDEVDVDERAEIDPASGRVTGRSAGHVVGLRRYLARGEITARQFRGGQLFIDIWEAAHATGLKANDIAGKITSSSPASSGAIVAKLRGAERSVAAAKDLARAIRSLGPCYSLIADVLLAMGTPRDWAARRWRKHGDHGFGVMLLGLDALADEFEIPDDVRP
jgi:hypothetical protein